MHTVEIWRLPKSDVNIKRHVEHFFASCLSSAPPAGIHNRLPPPPIPQKNVVEVAATCAAPACSKTTTKAATYDPSPRPPQEALPTVPAVEGSPMVAPGWETGRAKPSVTRDTTGEEEEALEKVCNGVGTSGESAEQEVCGSACASCGSYSRSTCWLLVERRSDCAWYLCVLLMRLWCRGAVATVMYTVMYKYIFDCTRHLGFLK